MSSGCAGLGSLQSTQLFVQAAFPSMPQSFIPTTKDNLRALFAKHPHLHRPFNNSIFPTCTFNCGSRVVTLDHVDSTNVPYGFCAIFTCGSYDPTKSGHLVLFDLSLMVQLPPGSSILIPSGTICHANVAIQPHETRQSFTQYCPGGLLRWVAYGFKAVNTSSESIRQQLEKMHKKRCTHAIGLFSKLQELHKDRVRIFTLKGAI